MNTVTPSSIFKSSNVYFAFALIMLSVTAVYGVTNYRVFLAEGAAIQDNKARIEDVNSNIEKTKSRFKEVGDENAKKQLELRKKIEAILPSDENYTELTRLLDNYFAEHDTPGNPIFQSSLRFGQGAPVPETPDVSALSISMNIEATRDNFFKFLDFVNNSASLETGTRLMEITSIQLNFPEGGEVVKDLKQKISFTVEMNAYYQTPKVPR